MDSIFEKIVHLSTTTIVKIFWYFFSFLYHAIHLYESRIVPIQEEQRKCTHDQEEQNPNTKCSTVLDCLYDREIRKKYILIFNSFKMSKIKLFQKTPVPPCGRCLILKKIFKTPLISKSIEGFCNFRDKILQK